MKRAKLLFLAGVIVLAYAVGSSFWWSSPGESADGIVITIEPGSSVSQIADELEENHIINSTVLFKAYVQLIGDSSTIQAGSFELFKGMSYSDILEKLTAGQDREEVSLTFIEGWTIDQMGGYIIERGIGSKVEWSSLTKEKEGYLFPDTYRFFSDVTMEEIVERMEAELFDKLTEEDEQAIINRGENLESIIIMASIIEREVRSPSDMKRVSGIFWNRLDIGMALQADSTVNYITGNKTPSVTFADRDIDSPYNTYKYAGLPPGPISNPGIEAIRAAISPEKNDYLYFLTDPEGNVFYGRTLEEHNANRVHLR